MDSPGRSSRRRLTSLARALLGSRQVGYPAGRHGTHRRRLLTVEEVARWSTDGYLVLRRWFSRGEAGLLREAMATDPQLQRTNIPIAGAVDFSVWFFAGDDTYGYFARDEMTVAAVARLIEDEPYMEQQSMFLKQPRSKGRIATHQDFGYTYSQGMLNPQKILQMVVAVDSNRVDNGCLNLLKGSHVLGRLEHADHGDGQLSAEPARVAAAAEHFPSTPLELEPGDVCFTHSCILHGSEPNDSDKPRWNMVVGYNGESNEPRPRIMSDNFGTGGTSGDGSKSIKPPFNKLARVPQGTIEKLGLQLLNPGRPASDFLQRRGSTVE